LLVGRPKHFSTDPAGVKIVVGRIAGALAIFESEDAIEEFQSLAMPSGANCRVLPSVLVRGTPVKGACDIATTSHMLSRRRRHPI